MPQTAEKSFYAKHGKKAIQWQTKKRQLNVKKLIMSNVKAIASYQLQQLTCNLMH